MLMSLDQGFMSRDLGSQRQNLCLGSKGRSSEAKVAATLKIPLARAEALMGPASTLEDSSSGLCGVA